MEAETAITNAEENPKSFLKNKVFLATLITLFIVGIATGTYAFTIFNKQKVETLEHVLTNSAVSLAKEPNVSASEIPNNLETAYYDEIMDITIFYDPSEYDLIHNEYPISTIHAEDGGCKYISGSLKQGIKCKEDHKAASIQLKKKDTENGLNNRISIFNPLPGRGDTCGGQSPMYYDIIFLNQKISQRFCFGNNNDITDLGLGSGISLNSTNSIWKEAIISLTASNKKVLDEELSLISKIQKGKSEKVTATTTKTKPLTSITLYASPAVGTNIPNILQFEIPENSTGKYGSKDQFSYQISGKNSSFKFNIGVTYDGQASKYKKYSEVVTETQKIVYRGLVLDSLNLWYYSNSKISENTTCGDPEIAKYCGNNSFSFNNNGLYYVDCEVKNECYLEQCDKIVKTLKQVY